ncbi:hypothetical protein [Gordonia sp. NPDC003376]
MLLALACGLLSSLVPYISDVVALRRVPAAMFGTFSSISPVWAALAGWLMLGPRRASHLATQLNQRIVVPFVNDGRVALFRIRGGMGRHVGRPD